MTERAEFPARHCWRINGVSLGEVWDRLQVEGLTSDEARRLFQQLFVRGAVELRSDDKAYASAIHRACSALVVWKRELGKRARGVVGDEILEAVEAACAGYMQRAETAAQRLAASLCMRESRELAESILRRRGDGIVPERAVLEDLERMAAVLGQGRRLDWLGGLRQQVVMNISNDLQAEVEKLMGQAMAVDPYSVLAEDIVYGCRWSGRRTVHVIASRGVMADWRRAAFLRGMPLAVLLRGALAQVARRSGAVLSASDRSRSKSSVLGARRTMFARVQGVLWNELRKAVDWCDMLDEVPPDSLTADDLVRGLWWTGQHMVAVSLPDRHRRGWVSLLRRYGVPISWAVRGLCVAFVRRRGM